LKVEEDGGDHEVDNGARAYEDDHDEDPNGVLRHDVLRDREDVGPALHGGDAEERQEGPPKVLSKAAGDY